MDTMEMLKESVVVENLNLTDEEKATTLDICAASYAGTQSEEAKAYREGLDKISNTIAETQASNIDYEGIADEETLGSMNLIATNATAAELNAQNDKVLEDVSLPEGSAPASEDECEI